VCVAPALSTAIKHALEAGDIARAEALRAHFLPLEDLRDHISPLRVLHEAVDQAGIAATGPMLPMLTRLGEADAGRVKSAAKALLAQDNEAPAQAAE
jgi:dihydrodipicolinate synthase/N-acetylneuraminate lyase